MILVFLTGISLLILAIAFNLSEPATNQYLAAFSFAGSLMLATCVTNVVYSTLVYKTVGTKSLQCLMPEVAVQMKSDYAVVNQVVKKTGSAEMFNNKIAAADERNCTDSTLKDLSVAGMAAVDLNDE